MFKVYEKQEVKIRNSDGYLYDVTLYYLLGFLIKKNYQRIEK